jgi:ribosomal protein S18 acetylase RimI-like enzyme
VADAPRSHLRNAKLEDADFIFGVLDEAIGPSLRDASEWDEAEQRRIVTYLLETADVHVIQVDEADAGYLAVWRSEHEIHVASIALSEPWRGKGLGTSLMRDLIDEASGRAVPVRLSVLSNNPAHELYERLGFVVTQVEGRKLRMERRTE